MARGGVELRPFDAGAAPTIAAHCEDVDAASLRKLRWLVRDVQRLGSPSPRVDALLAAAAASESLLFAPDVAKKRKKRKYNKRR